MSISGGFFQKKAFPSPFATDAVGLLIRLARRQNDATWPIAPVRFEVFDQPQGESQGGSVG